MGGGGVGLPVSHWHRAGFLSRISKRLGSEFNGWLSIGDLVDSDESVITDDDEEEVETVVFVDLVIKSS